MAMMGRTGPTGVASSPSSSGGFRADGTPNSIEDWGSGAPIRLDPAILSQAASLRVAGNPNPMKSPGTINLPNLQGAAGLITPNIMPANPAASSNYASSMAEQQGFVQAAQQRLAQQQTMQQAIQQNQIGPGPGNTGLGPTTSYSVPQVSGNMTPQQFAIDILKGEGIAPNAGNEAGLERWEAQEGGNWHNDASANPLNTTQAMPGYSEVGTQGDIGAYQNWEQGLAATLKTLNNGRYNGILQALHGSNVDQILAAISASPWGTKF